MRRLVEYCPETGLFKWRKRPAWMFGGENRHKKSWHSNFAGKQTFSTSGARGYLQGCVFGVMIYAHRAAWAFHYGEWPSGPIDHINGVRTDNRIENLRVVNNKGNSRNRAISSRNTSGVMGVTWDARKSKWMAKIGVNGKEIFLGLFDQKSDAAKARKAADLKYNFHPNHGRATV